MAAMLSMAQLAPAPAPTIIMAAGATPLLPLPPPAPLHFSPSKRSPIDLSGGVPTVTVEIKDPKHPGVERFEKNIDAKDCIQSSAVTLTQLLYGSVGDVKPPNIQRVSLILKDGDFLAYAGRNEDSGTIHLSLKYIADLSDSLLKSEITGVLMHELVHCYQFFGGSKDFPMGLVEGIADWVRLRCNLVPPHWGRNPNAKWTDGYHSTAYFLDYLSSKFGSDLVPRMNAKLRDPYNEGSFWSELTGKKVDDLWAEHINHLNSNNLRRKRTVGRWFTRSKDTEKGGKPHVMKSPAS